MRIACSLLCFLSYLGGTMPAQTAQPAAKTDALAASTQLLVVTTPDWNTVDGHLQRYERTSAQDPWHPVGSSIAVVVGKHGLAWGSGLTPVPGRSRPSASDPTSSAPDPFSSAKDPASSASAPAKREGDGKAPAGVFTLGPAFGYAPQRLPGSNLPYTPLLASTECVDDPASKHYNQIADRSAVTPDWNSSEHMRDTGESYRWGIVVHHNAAPPVAGRGSCIFLHIWSGAGQGTAGCTAMPQAELESLLRWLDVKQRPLLVQLPAQQYAELIRRWRLPTVIRLKASQPDQRWPGSSPGLESPGLSTR